MYNSSSWFGSTIFFLAAIYFGFQYCLHKTEADSAAQWTRISGIVETMTMTEVYHSRSRNTFTPHVAYYFTYKGRKYGGSTISYPEPTFYSAESKAFQNKYPEGGLVSVYYNPQDPTKNCLIPGEGAPLNNEGWYALGALALSVVLPMFPSRGYGYGYGYGGSMYNNPNNMITPSR